MNRISSVLGAVAGLSVMTSAAVAATPQTGAADLAEYVSGFTWNQVDDIDAATLPDVDQQAAATALALATPVSTTNDHFVNYLGGRAAIEASDAELRWQDVVDAYVWARMQSVDTPASVLETYASYVAVSRSLPNAASVQFSDLLLGYVWHASSASSASASTDARLAQYFATTKLPSSNSPVTLDSLIDGFVASYVDLGATGNRYAASEVVSGFTWGVLEAADGLQTVDGFTGWGDVPVGKLQTTNGFTGWGDVPVGKIQTTDGFTGWGDVPVGKIQVAQSPDSTLELPIYTTNGFTGWGDVPVGKINVVNGFTGWGDVPVGKIYMTNGFTGWGDVPVGKIQVINGFTGWGDVPVGKVQVVSGFTGWGDEPVGRITMANGTWGGLNNALLAGDLSQFDVSPVVADYIRMNRAVLN